MPKKPHLDNLAQKEASRQKQQSGAKRRIKIAIVTCPDGEWYVSGGNESENNRMSKLLFGKPDGAIPAWAMVDVIFPKAPKDEAPIEITDVEIEPPSPFNSTGAIFGNFAGPESPAVIDVPPIE